MPPLKSSLSLKEHMAGDRQGVSRFQAGDLKTCETEMCWAQFVHGAALLAAVEVCQGWMQWPLPFLVSL